MELSARAAPTNQRQLRLASILCAAVNSASRFKFVQALSLALALAQSRDSAERLHHFYHAPNGNSPLANQA